MSKYFYVGILGDYMAGNTVNIKMVLTADGVAAQQKAAKEIADNYERANRATSSMGKRSAPAPMSAAERSAPKASSAINEREYGQVRGAVGTGAAGRDFAKQAQGLGGLVALYATFAANIFAVGAAYEALNKAAAVERLTKATHLMSMQVGVNLKSISQNLVEASGHALSFADAMQFTNIGTSAGLAGKQIENLTKIARGAASALGRDANDSVRRIIQGTAKQEQEILDELGIFVKSKKAFDKYASEIGIKADDLSGIQRTQAYANEVERLGEKWKEFAEIPDPFSKFTATSKNALNEILGILSNALTPILEVLSKSEAAITAIILTITTSLAKRALPELGSMFNSFFNYDKQVATKQIDDNISVLNSGLSKVKGNVQKYADEISKLSLLPKFDAAAIEKQFKEFSAEKTKGKYTTSGIRTQPLVTDILGTINNPKDLSNLKSVEDLENKVLANIKGQLKGKTDISSIMEDLKAKNILTNESIATQLVLTDKIKASTAQIFAIAQANNNLSGTREELLSKQDIASKEALVLQAKIDEQQEKRNKVNREGGHASQSLARKTALVEETTQQYALATANLTEQQSRVNYLASKQAETNMRRANIALILEEAGLKQKEAMGNVASNISSAAASGGFISAPVKAIGAAFKDMGTQVKLAGAGISKAALAGNMSIIKLIFTTNLANIATLGLGTAFDIAKIAALGLGTALSLALGPITIAITLWSMFGEKLTDFLGITSDATRALDEAKKQQDEYAKTLEYSGAQLANLSKMRKESLGDLESESFYINKVISNLNNLNAAYDETQKKKDTKVAADAIEAARKDAENKGQAFNPTVYQARGTISATVGLIPEGTTQGLKELTDNLDKLAQAKKQADDAFSFTLAGDAYVVAKEKMAKAAQDLLDGEKKVQEFTKNDVTKGVNQIASATEKATNARKSMLAVLDTELERRKKLADPSLNTTTAESTQLMTAYKNSIESGGTAAAKTANMYDILSGAILLGGKTQVIAIAIAQKLALGMAEIDKLGLKTVDDLAARTAFLAGLSKEMTALGNSLGKPTTVKAPKAIKPYDAETKDLFAALKNDIAETDLKLKNLASDNSINQALETRLSAITGIASIESIEATKRNDNMQAELTLQKELTTAKDAFLHVQLDKSKVGEEGVAARKEAMASYVIKLKELGISKENADKLAEVNYVSALINQSTAARNVELKKVADYAAIDKGYADQRLQAMQAEQAYAESLGYLSEKEIATSRYKLDIMSQQKALSDSLLANEAAKNSALAPQQSVINTPNADPVAVEAAKAKVLEINALYAAQAGLITANANALAGQTSKAAERGIYLAGNNDQMKLMTELTTSLTGAFGDLGTNIGKAGEALLKMAQDDKKYAKDKIDFNKELAEAMSYGDTDAEEKANKKLLDLDKKATKDKLNNIAATASATKKMFAEHTGAYKLLNIVEKTSHAMQMANTAIELASEFSAFMKRMFFTEVETTAKVAGAATGAAASVAADGVAAGPKATNAILSAFGAPFPINFIAGAAMVAIVASLLGGSTPSVSIPGGMTAEDMQKSQGTGQSWVDGKLVDNGGGVFGDPTAKSESIQNSLDILTATSVEGLSFSNTQIELLTKIKDGIKEVAQASFGVQGIRSGSGFGTVEASTSNPGFLGLFASSNTSSIINSGIKLAGTFKSLGVAGNGLIQQFETVQTTSTDSGFFGIGASSDTSVDTYLKPLEVKAAKAIRETFQYMGNLLVDSGTKLGLTVENTLARANSLDIDITASLKGLTGTETQDELNAIFSSILDDAYGKVAPSLKKFKNFGEGFAETVTRVIDGFDKVNLGLTSMGLDVISFTEVTATATDAMLADQTTAKDKMDAAIAAVPKVEYGFVEQNWGDSGMSVYQQTNIEEIATANKLVADTSKAYKDSTEIVNEANAQMTTKGYDLSEALIKAAGGLDKFLEAAKLYSDVFLNEIEKLDIRKVGASNRLTEIGASKVVDNPAYAGGTPDNNGGMFGVNGEMLSATMDTNKVASDLFKTFSEGNDSIINTKKEYKSLLDASLQGAKDNTGAIQQEYIDLNAKLNDPKLLGAMQVIWDAEEESNKSKLDQATQLLGLQGKSYEVTQRERAAKLDLLNIADKSLIAGQQAIYAQEDINKTRGLEQALLSAQGNTLEVLNTSRAKELLSLSETDQQIQQNIWNTTDLANLLTEKGNLEISLLRAQGDEIGANAKQKAIDTKNMSSAQIAAYEYNQTLKDQIAIATSLATMLKEKGNLEISLLRAQGDEIGANARQKAIDTEGFNAAQLAAYNYNQLLKDQISILGQRKSLEDKLSSSLQATNIIRQRELATLDASNRPLQLLVYAIEDFVTSIEKAKTTAQEDSTARIKTLNDSKTSASNDISKVTGLLGRSADAEGKAIDAAEKSKVEAIQKQIDAITKTTSTTEEAVSNLKSIVDDLASAAKTLRDIPELAEQSYAAAMSQFNAIIAEAQQGKTPDSQKLSDTLGTITSRGSESYASSTDMKRDRLIAANKADYLNSLIGTQLTVEERSLANQETTIASLEAQIKVAQDSAETQHKALDAQLEAAQATLDRINGVDTSIMAMDSALREVAILDDKYQDNHIGLIEEQIKLEEDWLTGEFKRLDDLKSSTIATANATYYSASVISGAIGGTTSAVYSVVGAISQLSGALTTAKTSSVPGFAEGGSHTGGLRLVGENGPELEVTGPSTIIGSRPTAGLLSQLGNNTELIAEIRMLRNEVRDLRESARVTAEQSKITAKQLTRWEADGLPATTI